MSSAKNKNLRKETEHALVLGRNCGGPECTAVHRIRLAVVESQGVLLKRRVLQALLLVMSVPAMVASSIAEVIGEARRRGAATCPHCQGRIHCAIHNACSCFSCGCPTEGAA